MKKKANKLNIVKFVLDFIMVILMALFYKKNVLTIKYHEVSGLIILAIILIHLILNRKWIKAITKKIFSKEIRLRTKILYLADLLLLIFFIIIIITGILMSKFIFAINMKSPQGLHYFSSAIALLLVGIHLGLHREFITSIISNIVSLTNKIILIVLLSFITIFSCYGGYSLYSSDYVSFLSKPFIKEESHKDIEKENNTTDSKDLNKDSTDNRGEKFKGNGKGRTSISFSETIKVIGQYGSIVILFASITGVADYYICKKNQ